MKHSAGVALSAHTATIWIRNNPPPKNNQLVLLWNSFDQHNDAAISIPRYIEEHDVEIRARLLASIRDVKLALVDGKSVAAHLEINESTSYWWLTLFALKRWTGSSNIPLACKVIAATMILDQHQITSIDLECDSNIDRLQLSQCFSSYRAVDIDNAQHLIITSIHNFFSICYGVTRAGGSLLRYVANSRAISPIKDRSNEIRDLTFIDFLAGIDVDAMQSGKFVSSYWGQLPSLVADQAQSKSEWLHVYPRNVDTKGIRDANQNMSELNSKNPHSHSLLLVRPSLSLICASINSYFSLVRQYIRFRGIRRIVSSSRDVQAIWPLFEREWRDSLVGSTAIRHSILHHSIDHFVKFMPQSSTVIYLMENQPWELVFIQSFRKYQTGRIIGVAHSTVRFWDIRYFQDEREHLDAGFERIPYPDLVVTNASEAHTMLKENSSIKQKIVLGEALRYGYLNNFPQQANNASSSKRILILGDFLPTANDVLMRLVSSALEQTQIGFSVDIREHPVCSFTDDQLGNYFSRVTNESLKSLLQKADAIITTSSSSSAVESIMLGIPTIIVVDPLSLNYSPFRKTTRGIFVTSALELASALDQLSTNDIPIAANYFCLDDQYPRWKGLIRSN